MAEASNSLPPAKRPKRQCHYNDSWSKQYKGIGKSRKGETYAHCSLCNSDFSVAHGGKNDITSHVAGKTHKHNSSAATSSTSLTSIFRPQTSDVQIEAEARWSFFVAKHNLSFLTSDHANRLFSKMFPDSAIAKQFGCGRTKTTSIIKGALAPYYHDKVLASMSNPFSIMMDESNDKTDKSCIILARVLDSEKGEVCTRFLDMPIVNIGNAPNLFEALKTSLSNHDLDFSKAVAFMSDTTNVMKGARSGVQKLIKRENPSLYDVGCICHLANLTIKAGLESLPIDIDQLFVDVFYHFFHSSKRKQEFHDNWCSMFTSEPQTVLKHCPTRWLSLLRCVERYIRQLDGLISYFLSCDDQDDPSSKVNVSEVYRKHHLHLVHGKLSFVELYAANLLKPETITAAGDDLKNLKLERSGQLQDENLGIGAATWRCLAELEEVQDNTQFFKAVRKFYVETIKKMLKKFPFNDSLMKDLGILQPQKAPEYPVEKVLSLARRFPQLGLADDSSLDKLREEFVDFQLSPGDRPQVKMYKTGDKTEKPRAGLFWAELSKIKTFDGETRFPLLSKLMAGLLSIPCSNADSERGFSMLRKIHTDQRASLDHSTIVSLMGLKFNCDECCMDVSLDHDLLQKCKKATVNAVKRKDTESTSTSDSTHT